MCLILLAKIVVKNFKTSFKNSKLYYLALERIYFLLQVNIVLYDIFVILVFSKLNRINKFIKLNKY